jgi:purine nucleosidase
MQKQNPRRRRHRIILDCDPGRDDALAIAMVLASSAEIELAGITAVAGNVPLALTYRNARFICDLCGFPGMPVHAGADGPLTRQPVTGTRAHGDSGLEGLEVNMPPVSVESGGAVAFMNETLRAAKDDEITLVAIGPLTNLAILAAESPKVLPKIRQIVVMGGASRAGGNVTPSAEFNVYADPHAAARVLDCRRPMTIVSLDATHQVLAAPAHAERLARAGGEPARRLAALLRPAARSRTARFGPDRLPIHDPCTIAWLLQPELFRAEPVPVAVETEGTYTLGTTVVDWWGVTGQPPNAHWVTEADGEGVLDLLIERIGRL